MVKVFIILLLAGQAMAVPRLPLRLHESPRVMGMGGAYVALADDPQAGLLNPAGVQGIHLIGLDLTMMTATGASPDQTGAMLINPNSESGAAFAAGFLGQGLLKNEAVKYYVPYTSAGWRILGSTRLGLGVLFPYRNSHVDSISSQWETIENVGVLQTISTMQLGAEIERAFGGADDVVPRRLRLGASVGMPGQYAISYEWQGPETDSRYKFHWESSHLGAEISSPYVALRAGYVWAETHFFTTGIAVGVLNSGWRFETGWKLPTGDHHETQWSIGIGFRG